MNGPLCMYKLNPLISFKYPVDLTRTMYEMKNLILTKVSDVGIKKVNTLPNVLDQVNKIISKKSIAEVEDLKNRQEAILCQLTYLKEQMLVLREELNKKNSSYVQNRNKETFEIIEPGQPLSCISLWEDVLDEVVVHANPDFPPYTLLVLNHLWPGVLRPYLTCHTHSSIVSLPSGLDIFSSVSSSHNRNLKVMIIWKHMSIDCELAISPVTHTTIQGEVNVLRYLHRSINHSNDLLTEIKLDSLLDICHRLNHARTVKDKQALLRALNARLGKAEWFGGDLMSVADAAAWSSVRSLSGAELTQNMAKWLSRCNTTFGVGAA